MDSGSVGCCRNGSRVVFTTCIRSDGGMGLASRTPTSSSRFLNTDSSGSRSPPRDVSSDDASVDEFRSDTEVGLDAVASVPLVGRARLVDDEARLVVSESLLRASFPKTEEGR